MCSRLSTKDLHLCQRPARFPGRVLQPAFTKSQFLWTPGREMMGCGKRLKRPAIESVVGCESLNYKIWQRRKWPPMCPALNQRQAHSEPSIHTNHRAQSTLWTPCTHSLLDFGNFSEFHFFFFKQLHCAFSLQTRHNYQDSRPATRRKGKQLCLKLK